MKEYDIYLPSAHNDGTPIPVAVIERIKLDLAEAFGGYTHLRSATEGAWTVGGVTFLDEVTIVRVLDDGSAHFDLQDFKTRLEKELQQEKILIVVRAVETV